MNELTVHPNVYSTGRSKGLISMLERIWVREGPTGTGTFYIVSCFGNYNGGVRFLPVFTRHIEQGGRVVAIFGASAHQRLTSRQLVEAMLDCGAEVHIVNRRRLMHVKSYGVTTQAGDMLLVSSGNFTGPGMSQNVEMSILLDRATTAAMGFSWNSFVDRAFEQNWHWHLPSLEDKAAPVWSLLYDEAERRITLDETDRVTLVITLGRADTARINAARGTSAALGTQYFWLSTDCYDFFPPLIIPNRRGAKRTFSALINMVFVDLSIEETVRVTFEAENNLDFRLGTGPLRHSRLAGPGDLAAISRVGEQRYELRLYRQMSETGQVLDTYATNFVGHRGKRYGFVSNTVFRTLVGEGV